jgi:hypothetical protein
MMRAQAVFLLPSPFPPSPPPPPSSPPLRGGSPGSGPQALGVSLAVCNKLFTSCAGYCFKVTSCRELSKDRDGGRGSKDHDLAGEGAVPSTAHSSDQAGPSQGNLAGTGVGCMIRIAELGVVDTCGVLQAVAECTDEPALPLPGHLSICSPKTPRAQTMLRTFLGDHELGWYRQRHQL